MSYAEFIGRKMQGEHRDGFEPIWLPEFLFGFQSHLTEWAITRGRCALIEDCGLGKTAQQLVWAENCVRHTNRPALILTPLAVASQTEREAAKFGVDAKVSRDGTVHGNITITNYEQLHRFNTSDFSSVCCDEISCIKAFDGKRRKQVTRFMSKVPYRLGATATAAPNDFIELGTISEALGVMTQSDMLGMFFRNSDKMRHTLFKDGDFWNRAKWFFRAHGEVPFWRWVCSWARAIRKPSDIGFDDDRFELPPLEVTQHIVKTEFRFPGELFVRVARTLKEQREERKRTMRERCELVAKLVDHNEPAVVWCQYNEEGDILERLIPDAIQVAGCHSDDLKEERLNAFTTGQARVLVTKPKLGAWGLNWQHCGHHTFFPSHSFEQFYQAIRRSLRFGRIGPVRVDVIATEGESGVTANLQKKQRQADEMFDRLAQYMNDAERLSIPNKHVNTMEVPSWL
jgi:hypothetical protein